MIDDALKQGWKDDPRIGELSAWLVHEGLLGNPHVDFLEAYCQKLVALGVSLMRAHVTMNALHPTYGGVGFNWLRSDGPMWEEFEHTAETPDSFRSSPFFHMLTTGQDNYRERLWGMEEDSRFSLLNEMKVLGASDYFAVGVAFGSWQVGPATELEDGQEGALLSWMSDAPLGFSDADILLIKATYPTLCLALKSGANRQMARDLLGVYLGGDAGQRVLSGEIQRGSSERIDAVICYFDLQGFTGMSQKVEGEALLAMLNDYFGVVVAQIESNGGNVLKFMGDGLLAIFDRQKLSDAAERALKMAEALEVEMAELSKAREANGLPSMGYTMAIHAGPVLYGNMGGDARLDFTVIGPEVNLTARISGMHRSLSQRIIVSEAVARDVPNDVSGLVSLGKYMLRGVEKPQELFTIHRG